MSKRDESGNPSYEKAQKAGSHPLIELTATRIREFVREPEAIFWVFIFPVLLACALGIAFRNTPPEKIRVAVENDGQSSSISRVVLAFEKSERIQAIVLDKEAADRALRTGNVALIVRTADAGSSALPSNQMPPLIYRFDPTRPESQTARLAAENVLLHAGSPTTNINSRDETVSEPGARYIDFLIPGLIGLNLMGSAMWGLGFAIVSARNRKLLKRLAATPMRRSHFLLSFTMSRLLFLFLEVAALAGFARIVFGVRIHGSVLELAIGSLIGAMSFSGIGLLVASRPQTIEGVSGLMNFVMLPMWLLSGTFFSAARFPNWLQPFIKALPLTALNDLLRTVMNDGLPLVSHWPQLTIMLAWGIISFVIALKIFRWQ